MSRAHWRIGDRYELFHELGSGVCGSVWYGRDLRTGAEHAVKVLEPGIGADGDALAGYYALLGAVARLAHPNIVAADEVVALDDGRIALAMRRVPGVDLTTLLNTEGLPRPEQAALMAAQLADGLAAAHAVGVAHGDIKPANVLCEPGENRLFTARLTDFGIGLLVPPPVADVNAVLPPAEYLAPELSAADTGTAAGDVYALGILFYETLAGRPPFYGTHPDSIAELHRDVRAPWIRGLPELLWPPLAACLEKRPEARPTAAELAGRLRDIAGLIEPEGGFEYRAGPAFAAQGVSQLTGAAQRAADSMTIALAVPGAAGALAGAQRPYQGAGAPALGHAGPRAPRPARRRRVRIAEIAAAVVGVALGITLAVSGSGGNAGPNGAGAAAAGQSGLPFVALTPGPVGVAASGSGSASASASVSPDASPSGSASAGPSASGSRSAAPNPRPSQSPPSVPAPSRPAASPTPPAGAQGPELVSADSRKCLDTSGARFSDGTAIVLFTCDRDAGQGWTYTSSGQLTQDHGAYCLDDTNRSSQPGTKVQLWACTGNQNQQWVVHRNGSITNAATGLCLDVTNRGTSNGTPIELWSCNGQSNQQWYWQ